MGVKLVSSSAGSVEIIAPVTAFNYTLTAPALNATLITDSAGVLNIGSGQVYKDASGNVGVGVTPSAWSAFPALQFVSGYSVSQGGFGQNTYYNSGFKNITTGGSTLYQPAGNIHVWYNAPSGSAGAASAFVETMRVDGSGNLTIAGATATKASGTTWSNPSDQRLKNNIRDYVKGTTELMQVRVCEWEYNGKGGTPNGMKGLGVIADEVMVVLPNTVETYEDKLNADDKETTAIKKFDATEITWLLVKTVQEQQALITTLTERITALEQA